MGGLLGSYKDRFVRTLSGQLLEDSTYYYIFYAEPATFTNDLIVSGKPLTADVLVIAGGGGGGGFATAGVESAGGGGGAGGLILYSSQQLSGQYSLTVGSGGTGGGGQVKLQSATNGGNSQFGNLAAAIGGGRGGGDANFGGNAQNGGSGGGGSSLIATAGTGVAGQGNSGGLGRTSGNASSKSGGGGGGFTTAGGAASSGLPGNAGQGSQTYSSWLAVRGDSASIIGPVWLPDLGGVYWASYGGFGGVASAGTPFTNNFSGPGQGGTGGSMLTAGEIGFENPKNGEDGTAGAIIIRYTKSQILG